MQNIDGIPISNAIDSIRPVFDFFNLKIGRDSVIEKAIIYLKTLSNNTDFESKKRYLWIDEIINVTTVNMSVLYGIDVLTLEGKEENGIIYDVSSIYSKWIIAQGEYILSVLNESNMEDSAIQHWLNYEDFINELALTKQGCSILCEIYDLKGLDFFLFHYYGGQTDANSDRSMFDNAMKLSKALNIIVSSTY